jgi:hypothetical protein
MRAGRAALDKTIPGVLETAVRTPVNDTHRYASRIVEWAKDMHMDSALTSFSGTSPVYGPTRFMER